MSTAQPNSAPLMVINVGSSSCKVTIAGANGPEEVDTGEVSPVTWGAARWRELMRDRDKTFEPDYVLHRFVHGGGVFHGPTVTTPSTRTQLEAVVALAPLHTTQALTVLDSLAQAFPGATAIACFDTTFHETLAPAADTYLGSGSSLAAIVDGSSVDITMGFTPVDGLVMATRPGSLDAGAILWLLGNTSIDVARMSSALEHSSGLTGLAGHSDMKQIMHDAEAGQAHSVLAYDVWLHRLVGKMGDMIAVMGGVDLIVFGGASANGLGSPGPQVPRRSRSSDLNSTRARTARTAQTVLSASRAQRWPSQ